VQVNTADIAGTVSDPSHRPVANGDISLSQPETGLSRHTTSGAEGGFRFSLLPPGRYSVRVDVPGFGLAEYDEIEVNIGETASLQVELSLKPVTFHVSVTGALPVIDYQRTQQSTIIGSERLQELPVNQRNYLGLALLAPGVVDTTTIADQADFRPTVAPTSNLGFSGSNGRGNEVAIDGMTVTATGGFVRSSLPMIGVQEFQVNRNAYSATLGGVQGGIVDIVSKSGTNGLHGTAFAYLRDRAIQARNYFDPGKSAYTRVQSGGSLDGSLVPNRTFFFAAMERLDRHETVFVPIQAGQADIQQPTLVQQQLINYLQGSGNPKFAGLGTALRGALTPVNNPRVSQLFAANTGTFPLSGGDTTASLRLDHRFNERNSTFLRTNIVRQSDQNTSFGGLTGYTGGGNTSVYSEAITLGHTAALTPSLTSVTRLSYGRSHFVLLPNDPYGPEVDIGGIGTFGRNGLYPEDSTERSGQVQPTLQWNRHSHTLTAGIDFYFVKRDYDIKTYQSGRFVFGEYIPLGALIDSASGALGTAALVGQQLASAGQPALGASLATPITSLQSYALGLPVAYVQGFGNSKYQAWQESLSGFVEDFWRVRPGLTFNLGLRYQFDHPPAIASTNSVVPRFGVAWSPWKTSAFLIRAGYGIFQAYTMGNIPYLQTAYTRPDLTLIYLPLTGVPGIINPQTGAALTSADIYQSLLVQGVLGHREIRQSDLAALGLPPGFRFPTTGGVQSNYVNPYTHQASVEAEWSAGSWAFSTSLEGSRAVHLWRTRDQNLVQVGTRPDGWPIFGYKDPQIVNNYLVESAANAFYMAGTIQVNKRFRRHFGLNAHYTLSHATDEATDFTIDYTPANQLDPRADRGLSAFNQKHRFVLTAVAELPHTLTPVLRDWTISPIFSANSARPFNVLTGFDNLGDGQISNHRPLGLGRNAGIGPAYSSADLRLARSFLLRPESRFQVRFTAEVFNLLNHANFAAVNNVVGDRPLAALPQPLAAHPGDPLLPFSYTSAKDPRQFQFGLGLRF
jgi:hypothetical protein